MQVKTKNKELPLKGLRVLGFTQSWTGPFCGCLLADLGAEHLRVEQIQYAGGMTRGVTPFPLQDMWLNSKDGGIFNYPDRMAQGPNNEYHMNRFSFGNAHLQNCKGFTLDFMRPKGMELFVELLKMSDVFVENNTPTTAPKLGLTWEFLHEINPKLIVIRSPAFGLSGRSVKWKGFGSNVEAGVGHTYAYRYSDDVDDAVSSLETYSMDNIGSHSLAAAAMMGMLQVEKTGKGMLIEIPQAEGVLDALPAQWMDYFVNGRIQPAWANRHPSALQGAYPTNGDEPMFDYVAISIFNDAEWDGFVDALGNPAWAKDEKFADAVSRLKNQDELDKHIAEWTKQHNKYAIMHMLQAKGVPAGPVMTEGDAFADPSLLDHNFFVEETQKWCGTHKYAGQEAIFMRTPRVSRADFPPTGLGEYNEYVFKEILKLSDADYQSLIDEEYIGTEMVAGAKSSL